MPQPSAPVKGPEHRAPAVLSRLKSWFGRQSRPPRTFDADAAVRAAYGVLLGRAPDVAGRQHFIDAMERGATLEQLFDEIVRSDEFSQRFVEFVDRFRLGDRRLTLDVSQHGELPLLLREMAAVTCPDRLVVDVGARGRRSSNSYDLLRHFGWRGLLIEANPYLHAGFAELIGITKICKDAGYGPDRVRVDPAVVRGLEYYTGPVYEADLTFEIKDEKGNPVRFGSVAGGGRYDGLVARFRGEKVPATGFSCCPAPLTIVSPTQSERVTMNPIMPNSSTSSASPSIKLHSTSCESCACRGYMPPVRTGLKPWRRTVSLMRSMVSARGPWRSDSFMRRI
jgi:hypothetical protein